MKIKKMFKGIKYTFKRYQAYCKLLTAETKGIYSTICNEFTDLRKYIALSAHGLEKGAGIRNTRTGYGVVKAKGLLENIEKYLQLNGRDEWAIQEGISVLAAYIEYQKAHGCDISELEDAFKAAQNKFPYICDILEQPLSAGTCVYKREDLTLLSTEKKAVEAALKKRHSVRFYKKTVIDRETVHDILSYAQTAPSACNRQTTHVWYSMDPKKNARIDACVPGNGSFRGEIPYFFVVTGDKFAFTDSELFQWYVNGGIYTSHLVLAIHAHGLGGIIFQWPNCCEYEKEIRSITGIPSHHSIVAIVGYGEMEDHMECLCAARKSISEVGHEF